MSRRNALLIGAGVSLLLLVGVAVALVVDARYGHPSPPPETRDPNGKCPVCRREVYIPPEAPDMKRFFCPHCDTFNEALIYRQMARPPHPTLP